MYRIYWTAVLITILLIVAACGGQSDEQQEIPEPQGWAADIQWLRDTLPRLHYNLFMYQPQDSFYNRLDSVEEDLPNLTEWEIVMDLSRALASMQCSHTGIGFFEFGSFNAYPVSVWWLDDGLYVTAIDQQYSHLIGSELIGYGGRPALEAASAMADMFPDRNSVAPRTWATNFMMLSQPMEALGFGDADSPVPFTFRLPRGDTLTLHLYSTGSECVEMLAFTAAVPEELPIYLQSDDFYWYRNIPEDEVLYIAYNTCALMPDYHISSFVEDLDDLWQRVSVQGIVVDLRRNSGGNSLVAAPLIEWLQEVSEEGGTEIYLVIGRWTYSSGILNAIQIRDLTGAVLIGEATSGAPNHLGEVRTARLPWSGLSVGYPTKYFETVDGDGATLEPDIDIPLSSEALFHGRDEVLETIVEIMEDR